uniref:Uncharacterized protein n=1 Tax=Fagus sylvatica TaxID=28930 RepID=A0A2N9J9L0_FAGSY
MAVGHLQSVHYGHGKPPVQAGVALSVAKPPDLLKPWPWAVVICRRGSPPAVEPWVMGGGTTAGTKI